MITLACEALKDILVTSIPGIYTVEGGEYDSSNEGS